MYNTLLKTFDELKINIEREIKKISKKILKVSFLNFEKRCDFVLAPVRQSY